MTVGIAESLSFLHVLLVLGVKLTSLLTSMRQNCGIGVEGAYFWKIKNSPIKRQGLGVADRVFMVKY
jgi:hypothetical protein